VCQLRRSNAHQRRTRENDPARGLWQHAKQRAKQKGVPCTITVEDVRACWPADGRCPVLGIPLERGRGASHDASPSLDRLNSAWGYEPGNICVISHRANSAKRALRASELEAIAAWMRQKGLD
jgi:hypothetical protein